MSVKIRTSGQGDTKGTRLQKPIEGEREETMSVNPRNDGTHENKSVRQRE